MTSNEYLMSILTYNQDLIFIEFGEDTWKIWAKADYAGTEAREDWAICFDNMVTFDFEDELHAQYGTWNGYPYTSKNVGTSWVGLHQYMKIRLINHSENNMIGFRFRSAKDGNYFTTCVASNMYLQGGVGTNATTPTDDWKVYIFDCNLASCLASNKASFTIDGASKTAKTYTELLGYVQQTGSAPGNNWVWAGAANQMVAMQFNLLGACSSYHGNTLADPESGDNQCDSRMQIKRGAWVEVDYIIFGSSPEQLLEWKSYAEQKAEA